MEIVLLPTPKVTPPAAFTTALFVKANVAVELFASATRSSPPTLSVEASTVSVPTVALSL